MLTYYTIPPLSSLAKYIRTFWVLEGKDMNGHPYIHRTLADGNVEMFFHYQGAFDELLKDGNVERSILSGVSGPSQKFNRFRIAEDFGMIGVYLYPFALQKFFNIPASFITNQSPDLVTLLGQEGKDLQEKIMMAKDNLQRVGILSSYFLEKLKKDYRTDRAIFSSIHKIIQTSGTIKIKELATSQFLSSRQFERKFKMFSGFSPKLYSRIIRFQSVISSHPRSDKSLTEIAYDCGYYDQSHFIHDFKEFSGYNPKEYFGESNEATQWREE
jgi:AraC-like DNA-binding protein